MKEPWKTVKFVFKVSSNCNRAVETLETPSSLEFSISNSSTTFHRRQFFFPILNCAIAIALVRNSVARSSYGRPGSPSIGLATRKEPNQVRRATRKIIADADFTISLENRGKITVREKLKRRARDGIDDPDANSVPLVDL